MDVTFPSFVVPKGHSLPRLVRQVRDRRRGVTGAETVVAGTAAHWEVSMVLHARGEKAQLDWAAFEGQMEGGIGICDVPLYLRHRPRNRDGLVVPWRRATSGFSDAQSIDHFAFEQAALDRVRVASAGALRATVLEFELVDCDALRPGHFFSIGSRLYRVLNSWVDGAVTRAQFHPPLRASVDAGAAVEVDGPTCRMRFHENLPVSGDQHANFWSINAQFVEEG